MKNGEIWVVDFEPSIGHEVRKSRPAVIVNSDDIVGLDLRIVAPFTDAGKFIQPWHVKVMPTPLNKLKKASLVDTFQMKSVSVERLTRKIGILSARDMDSIKICITKVLDLY